MSSEKKLSKRHQLKLMEQHLINHSFIIDALIHIIIENNICTFDELQQKIQKNVKIVEKELHNNSTKSDEESSIMNYFGPMGEA
jgi:hypothetical protein